MGILLWSKRILIGAAGLVGLAAASGSIYEGISRHNAARRFPAPGVMVDVGGGRRLQLDCRGAGSPTVVLESGLDDNGSLAWAAVHDSIAKTTRVCAYSRPGIMWSDPTDKPFDVKVLANDLHRALVTAGESAPWVMVGHSIGGPYVMMFTKLYDSEVAGLVLVDPTHPDQFPRFQQAVGKSILPSPALYRFGASMAWSGLVRLVPADPMPASWPREVTQEAPAFLPRSIDEMAKEVEAIPATLAATDSLRSLGDRPLIVLSATVGQSPAMLKANGLTQVQGDSVLAVSQSLHHQQASWSSNGRHELVAGASHPIHLDRPDAVIAAVREVCGQLSNGSLRTGVAPVTTARSSRPRANPG